ncbi:BTB/POZ domain-containing protein 6-B-like isoform X2 [Paramacrobiotus metropolitanus]|uniref:BTB/POZ domain-containing protein 6-B-like isoform X2 n=1 Tax=Paramacrobiotus metropolitanus TaxID=2943436 RepID=UPI0024464147|nr:BTB/POZ domain-containing protein 6-B-like isoform X2 [Paramacrobiotus metropolitanus]
MLSYIYENAVDDLNWQNVFPTLYCADKYDLPWLAEICCVYLQVELNTENCLIALENINVWGPNFDSIVEACLDLIDASDGAVFQSEYFTGLSHGTLQMVVQRPTLAAPEYIIYTAVEAWAVEACKRKNVDPSTTNRREILGAVLFLVRFPLLTDAELASGPLKNALLLPAELWDIFMYKHNNENLVLSFDCEPRSYVQYRVGEAVFKHNEMVFAQGVDDVWYPAEVIGVSEQNVRIRWMRKMNNWWPFMSPQYIIRAADILQRGQRLHILVSGVPSAVSYCYRRAGLHVVEVDGREMSVKTEDLLLRQDEVIAWKAANKEEVNC